MTHQEMFDEVSAQIRDTKVSSSIGRWLNMAIDLYSTAYVFGELHYESNFATIPSVQKYPLSNNLKFQR